MMTATVILLSNEVVVASFLTGLVALYAVLMMRVDNKEIKEIGKRHWRS